MGWEHEGQKAGEWDRSVLGFDEAWTDAETRSGPTLEDRQHCNHPDAFQQRTDYPKRLDKGKGRATEQDL